MTNEHRQALMSAANFFNSTLSDYVQVRHTRREVGIQCHGW